MKKLKRYLTIFAFAAGVALTSRPADACSTYTMWNDADCVYGCVLEAEGDGWCYYTCPYRNC